MRIGPSSPSRLLCAIASLSVLIAACDAGSVPDQTQPANSPVPTGAGTRSPDPGCALEGEPLPRTGPTAEPTVLLDGTDGPRVEAVVYPHPSYEGDPWSQWGQGLVLPDGRFLSAIGDHLGVDGNSYLYEYSPDTDTLTQLTDVLSLTDHEPGAWGYGKIHAQMVPGPCGEVYFTTYWGSNEGLTFSSSYGGDRLFRIDSADDTIADLGTPVPEHGLPSLAGWAEGGLLYGEAPDPLAGQPWQGPFFVYDLARGETIFEDADRGQVGFRNVAVDAQGRAYYSAGNGVLRRYDPRTGEARDLPDRMPGPWMRASTRPAADGTVYGVTTDPDVFFAIEPPGTIRTIGPARGYTTSITLDPDGTHVLYVPGAYGDSWEQGAPLISVDPATGDEQVIVELEAAAEQVLGFRLGGTYDLAVDAANRIAYIGMNAGTNDSYGEVVLLIVHLP